MRFSQISIYLVIERVQNRGDAQADASQISNYINRLLQRSRILIYYAFCIPYAIYLIQHD